ncbi:VOC family protein [Neobacillus drentensis]|uniref:VOC family protein n=1 Tax=Neobacillus drentensis TaxID=220684 RepID=UPI002857FB14|nr:VOC family protein [Neobacillus drentensis]MDR7236404.1 catechol 2,3-dioxygenase-like lactoylglutathione lyase family enzyme [Neobacillus drentensis]
MAESLIRKPKLGTNEINQIAFVFNDLEKATISFAKLLGSTIPKPFITAPEEFSRVKHYGQPTPARNKLVFLDTPGVQVELIGPDTVPNLMRECLNRGEGFNHIAFDVDNIAEAIAEWDEKYTVAQTGEFHPDKGRYAFLDTRERYKTYIELLEHEGPKPNPNVPLSPLTGDKQYEGRPLLGTNKIAQIAFVVKDVKEAQSAWCNMLGVEHSTIFHSGFEGVNKVAEYNGQPTTGRSHFTFIQTPHIQVELVQPDQDSPSTWLEHLEKHGEGLHHIAFFVDSLDEKRDSLNSLGFPTIQEGLFYDGSGKYAYMDTTSEYSVIIELLEMFK